MEVKPPPEVKLAWATKIAAAHKQSLQDDIDKTQGDLHDLELELEDMKCDGVTDGDEFNDLSNLIYYLNEYLSELEDALGELNET